MRKNDETDVKLGVRASNRNSTRIFSVNNGSDEIRCDSVQLGAIVSRDPVRQAITMTESTTPLNADPDSNASLWYALQHLDCLRVRRILI